MLISDTASEHSLKSMNDSGSEQSLKLMAVIESHYSPGGFTAAVTVVSAHAPYSFHEHYAHRYY